MTKKRKNLSLKEKKLLKGVALFFTAIAAANVVYYLVLMFGKFDGNFYTKHFLIPIDLLCIGIIAIIMPYANKYSSYQANVKGDKYMYLIGICLIFMAFITLIFTFAF